jgi:cytoskeletal protein CcmA (bactofilin family)
VSPRALPRLTLLALTALTACTTTDVVATVSDGGSGPGPDALLDALGPACTGDAPPRIVDPGGAPLCPAELAAGVFRHALCACQEITTNDAFAADSFDSRQGPYSAAAAGTRGDVATNGKLQSTGIFDVRGALTATGDPGIRVSPALTVTGALGTRGILDGAATTVTIGGDADVGGNITLADLTVTGTLRVPAGASIAVSGTQSTGALVREPVDVPLPCACDAPDLIDVAGLVAVHAGDNDNAAIGLDPAALSNFAADTTLTLPCGRFYLERVQSNEGSLTLAVTGHAAVFLREAITLGRSLTIDLASGGELDLFIADHINVAGDVRIGLPDAPSRVRVYVGGAGSINMSAASVLAADLYAPLTDLSFSAGTEIFGAAFVGRLLTAGPVRIHYDTSVLDPAACP